jgi:hypothetical protein
MTGRRMGICTNFDTNSKTQTAEKEENTKNTENTPQNFSGRRFGNGGNRKGRGFGMGQQNRFRGARQ